MTKPLLLKYQSLESHWKSLTRSSGGDNHVAFVAYADWLRKNTMIDGKCSYVIVSKVSPFAAIM